MGTPNTIGDCVLVQSTTTGTGAYQLGAALDGHFSFAAAGVPSGARVSYVVVDSLLAPTQREVVEGIYTAGSPASLSRLAIKRSTTGGAIPWGVGTRYIFLAPNAGNLVLRDTDGLLPLDSLPPLAGNQMVGLSGAWADSNIDPGTSETVVFTVPIPPRTRIIRGVARITGAVGSAAASLLPRAYLLNASGNPAFAAVAPVARGAANGFIDSSFQVSFDLNPGTVGNSTAWALRFNSSRNLPVSMLEYAFAGLAVCDAV